MEQIQIMAIDDITLYENNPRFNDEAVEKVANSLKRFGWQQPIAIDKDNIIVAGHTRYKAAKELGYAKVPVIYTKHEDGTWLTPEENKAYRLADNKTAEQADWDFDKLNMELAEINDINMQDFGFEQVSADDLPDDLFEDGPTDVNDEQDSEPDNLRLDWGTNEAPITKEEQELLDDKFSQFDSTEGNKSFLQFLLGA